MNWIQTWWLQSRVELEEINLLRFLDKLINRSETSPLDETTKWLLNLHTVHKADKNELTFSMWNNSIHIYISKNIYGLMMLDMYGGYMILIHAVLSIGWCQ